MSEPMVLYGEPMVFYGCAACGVGVVVPVTRFQTSIIPALALHMRGQQETFPGDSVALVCETCQHDEATGTRIVLKAQESGFTAL